MTNAWPLVFKVFRAMMSNIWPNCENIAYSDFFKSATNENIHCAFTSGKSKESQVSDLSL